MEDEPKNFAPLDAQLLEKIRSAAKEMGFSHVEALSQTKTSPVFQDFYQEYLASGRAADLAYLFRKERHDLNYVFEGVRSILLFVYPYRFRRVEEKLRHAPFKIARYAWQRDYHFFLKEKLQGILSEFELTGRAVTDSAPVVEKYWARLANLGKVGRHGLLINPVVGSYFLIASLLLAHEIVIPPPLPMDDAERLQKDIADVCGSCTLCVDACPTEALLGNGLMQTDRCLSYRTIESRSDIASFPPPRKKHKWIFGCDICQQVCPHNKGVFANDRFLVEDERTESIAHGASPPSRRSLEGSVFYRRGIDKVKQNRAAVE